MPAMIEIAVFFSRTHKIFVAKEKGIFYMFGSYHTGTTHHHRRLFRCEFAFQGWAKVKYKRRIDRGENLKDKFSLSEKKDMR